MVEMLLIQINSARLVVVRTLRHVIRARVLVAAIAATALNSCGGGTSDGITDPLQRHVATVTLSGVPVEGIVFVDSTTALVAVLRDDRGLVLERAIAWTSSNSTVASVDPNTGSVRGLSVGSVVITARSDNVSATASLAVRVTLAVPGPGAVGPTTTTVLNGAVSLTVPPGATTVPILSVAPATTAPTDDRVLPNSTFDFGPSGTFFSTPVTLSISYDRSAVTLDDQSELRIYQISGTTLAEVPNGTVDLNLGIVSAPISHFSRYALVRRARPASLSIANGNTQSAVAGTNVAIRPGVLVRDAIGRPVPRVRVRFAVASGDGSIVGSDLSTSDDGGAATLAGDWRLGAIAGANSLSATVEGFAVPAVTFTATGTAPPLPIIGLSPVTLTFAGQTGAANPAAKNVSVTNAGALALTGLSVGAITYSGGSSGWIAATLNSSTAPATLTVIPNVVGVPPGSYAASVAVQSSLSGVAPQSVAIALTVNAALTATQAIPNIATTVNVAVPAVFPVTASGGTPPYAFALSGGTLPAGMNFNTSTGALSGTPSSTLASTAFTVTVTDAAAATAFNSFTLAVTAVGTPLTTTQSVSNKVGTANTPIPAFTPVTPSGGTPPYGFALSGGTLPTGMSFSTTTGAVSGTPTSTLTATVFTVTVTDAAAATSAKTFTLTVNSALTTSQAVPSTAGTVNTLIATFIPVTASGGTTPYAYALSGGALPTGMSFNTATGAVSGTPTTALASTVFTVTVTDGATATSAKTFTLTVSAAATPLTTTQAVPSTTGTVNTLIATFIPVTASGGTPPYTYALSGGTLPTGMSFSTATGGVSGTPTTTLSATTFTVTVTDAAAATSAKTFVLTVNAAGTPVGTVAISTSSRIVALGGSLLFSATIRDANGNFLFGRTVTWSSSTPSVATITQVGFVGTVALGTTTITATCEGVSTTQQIWVVTLPVNLSVFAGNNQTATVGTQLPIAPAVRVADAGDNPLAGFMVNFNVFKGGGSVTGAVVAANANGVATVGSWTLGQSAGLNELLGGSYAVSGLNILTFQATGSLPGAALATTQAIPSTTGTVNALIPTFIPVMASGGTAPYTYALSGATLPPGMSFNTSTGAVSGTPTATLVATTFTVTVTDAAAATSSKTFSLTVNPVVVPVGTVAIATSSLLVSVGGFLSYSATIRDAAGNFLFGRTVTWSSSAPTVATITQGGFVSALALGTTTITATCEGVSTSQTIWIASLPVTISVFAGNNQTVTVGTQLPIAPSVRVADAGGNPLVGFMIYFPIYQGGGAATGDLVATNANGVATVGSWTLGQTAGSNQLGGASYAVSGLSSATIQATGTPGPAVSMSVSPLNPLIAVGETSQLVATPRDVYSNAITGATVTWLSSSPGIASIGGTTGLATANTIGDATMTATLGAISGTAVVHVGAPSIYDGSWDGTTSAGHSMGYIVQMGRITSFAFGVGFSTNGCYVSVETNPYAIIGAGGAFSLSWPGGSVSTSASGTFSSATSASGSHASVTLNQYFCYPSTLVSGTTGGRSWTAIKQ